MKDKLREWLSDNLRYILLALGVLVVVVLIFFGVRFLTSTMDKGSDSNSKSGSKVEAAPTPTPETSKEPGADSSSVSEPEPETTLTRDGNAGITALMNTYYTALGGKDMESLKAVVDNLSEEEQSQISAEANIEGYSDIAAYTVAGQQEGTYVVFVTFNSKYKDIDTKAPGLTQMYVYTNTEGKLVIAAEVTDEAVKSYMTDLLSLPEAKTLIEETQRAYDDARASDAKLDALITSVSGQ